jgi:hypothetical protein
MKKIIFTISILLLSVIAVTWLYFKNLSTSENSSESVFKVIPTDASLIFEYKNEDSFYDIFKNFSLFRDVLGKHQIEQLGALKKVFIDDASFTDGFNSANLFFSIHKTKKNEAEVLIIAPFINNQNIEKFVHKIKIKYKLTSENDAKPPIYQMLFSNQSKFYFMLHQSLLVGSFDRDLVISSKKQIESGMDSATFKIDFKSLRNKNSIANLYINFSKLPDFLNNFTNKKNPEQTLGLKSVTAFASLNINYKSDAFMFSGITAVDTKATNYFNLFLNQQPGKNTLKNVLAFDAASYNFFYVSDWKKFKKDLNQLFEIRKETQKMKAQLKNIDQRHSINIERELIPILGNEFGVMQLASGDKIGLLKTKNTNRLSFLLSTISTENDEEIRHFDDSFLLYYYLGDPFKYFTRPYYAIIENHLVVANNVLALRRFLDNYRNMKFLDRTEKNINFQQYLSNEGNIFYFIHNSNAKGVIKSFLSPSALKNFKSDNFDWNNIYGLSIQFSADKDKFYTNLYMNKISEELDFSPRVDSLFIDSLTQ